MTESPESRLSAYLPEVGCALLLATLVTMCFLPYLVVGAMDAALSKLHLWSPVAMLCVVGILAGSLINVPLRYVERATEQVVLARGWTGWIHHTPMLRRTRTETIIAVNIGGCVIPTLLACYELIMVISYGTQAAWTVAVVTFTNILVCYYAARPITGVGIGLPWFLSPGVTVCLTWLLMGGTGEAAIRAPIAFVGGVLGPLVGADLLRLRDFTRISVGVLSIGGAGTFDGIVLSGIIAAILA